MHRIAPSQVLRFIATTAVILLLTPLSLAAAQQKPAPPLPNSQAQLGARVKDLEARLNAAEQKAASAAMEKDYITRVQKQYETYYEKAFNTQVWTLSILGLILTAVFFLAGRIGFAVFDRRIDSALREASTQLRTEFAQLLGKETQALREANSAQLKTLEDGLTKRITEQVQDLKTRSSFEIQFVQGLAAAADKRYADARNSFRRAMTLYTSGKPRQLIEKRHATSATRNLFVMFEEEDKANFTENAKEELARPLYNDLGDELAQAALTLGWLTPLLNERKSAQSRTIAAEPKLGKATPIEPKPPGAPDDDK